MSGSGISWAMCKSAPRSRQITMPAPHHSVFFTCWMPCKQPTVSKHWRHTIFCINFWYKLFRNWRLTKSKFWLKVIQHISTENWPTDVQLNCATSVAADFYFRSHLACLSDALEPSADSVALPLSTACPSVSRVATDSVGTELQQAVTVDLTLIVLWKVTDLCCCLCDCLSAYTDRPDSETGSRWLYGMLCIFVASLLWHCYLGARKSVWPVKIEWCDVGVVICLEQGVDCLHMVQPLSFQNPIVCFLINPAHWNCNRFILMTEPLQHFCGREVVQTTLSWTRGYCFNYGRCTPSTAQDYHQGG